MKTCIKCLGEQPLDRFPINDYGKHIGTCKDCINKAASKSYYDRKLKLVDEIKSGLSYERTIKIVSEIKTPAVIKCKDFFFYE